MKCCRRPLILCPVGRLGRDEYGAGGWLPLISKRILSFFFFLPSYDSDAHYKDISPSHWLHPFQRALLSFFLSFSLRPALQTSASSITVTTWHAFFFFYFQPAFKLVYLYIFASHVIFIETEPKSCKFKRAAQCHSRGRFGQIADAQKFFFFLD